MTNLNVSLYDDMEVLVGVIERNTFQITNVVNSLMDTAKWKQAVAFDLIKIYMDRGDSAIVKQMLPLIHEDSFKFYLVDACLINNNFEMFKLLVDKFIDESENKDQLIRNYFTNSSFYDRFEFLKFIKESFPEVDLTKVCSQSIESGIRNNNIELLKFLFNLFPEFPKNNQFHSFMCTAFSKNDINLVQYLYSLNPGVNLHYSDEKCFRQVCSNGNLELLQFLIEKTNGQINWYAQNNAGIQNALLLHRFPILRHLYKNISSYRLDDSAFQVFELAKRESEKQLEEILKERFPNIEEKYKFYKEINSFINNSDKILELIQNHTKQDLEFIRDIIKSKRLHIPLFAINFSLNPVKEECPICKDHDVQLTTSCGHRYCIDCLSTWIARRDNCPYCREKF